MSFLLFLIILMVVYVIIFKDDFTKEHIEKVTPFLAIIGVVIVLLILLSSLVN